MAKLFLHIGHGKTGSSYIQSSLAASHRILQENGLTYPAHADIAHAAGGGISSGNRAQFLSLVKQKNPSIEGDMLFSSEFFFAYLVGKEPEPIRRFIADNFSEVRILLFIRDPVAHASSSYLQMVKIGYTQPIEAFFARYKIPKAVNRFLDSLATLPQTELTVENYTAVKDVVSVVESWLGLDRDALSRPPVAVVNRSLTRAELELQRRLNLHLGRPYRPLAWALCNALPDLTSDPVYPSTAVQEELWTRLADEIERVNSRVKAEARYRKDRDIHVPTVSDDERCEFSREQLDVVAKVIADEIKGRNAPDEVHENLRRETGILKQRAAQFERRARRAEAQLSEIYGSSSWRLSRPLRALSRLARGQFRRGVLDS